MCLILLNLACHAQKPNTKSMVINPSFNQKISSMLSFNVPLIGVKDLSSIQNKVYILDAREKEEYDVSHIKGAIHIGYNNFDNNILSSIPKDAHVVIYCSIGYRSEKLGSKLIKMGYKNVHNLYGSIFEWVNEGNHVYDINEKITHKVHTYNKSWSKWVDNCNYEKVW